MTFLEFQNQSLDEQRMLIREFTGGNAIDDVIEEVLCNLKAGQLTVDNSLVIRELGEKILSAFKDDLEEKEEFNEEDFDDDEDDNED